MPIYGGEPSRLGIYTTLFRLLGADMNSVADQQLERMFPFSVYLMDRFIITNASRSMANAVGGIYTSPGKTGWKLVDETQRYAGLVTSDDVIYPALGVDGQNKITLPDLYLSLTVPQGQAGTADLYAMGVAG